MAINFGLLAAATVSFGLYWLCWECLKLRGKGKPHRYGASVLLASILTLVTPTLFSLVAVDFKQPWYFGGGLFGGIYLWTNLRYIWFPDTEKK